MEERKNKVRILMNHLHKRFKEVNIQPEEVMPMRWEAFNELCANYIFKEGMNFEIVKEVSRGVYCSLKLAK